MKIRSALLLFLCATAQAASDRITLSTPGAPTRPPRPALSEKLGGLRSRVLALESELIEGMKSQHEARDTLRKIQTLLSLQRQERLLGRERMAELEHTVGELETRRGLLRERILLHRNAMRLAMIGIHSSLREPPRSLRLPERERLEAPRRKSLSMLVDRGLKELEALKADVSDADQLEARIIEEREQLAYLFHDLKEQESVLELNRQLKADFLRQKHAERIAQLDNYRKLKTAETQVARLLGEFNARRELEKTVETERVVSKAMLQGAFARLKGRLPLPAAGRVISRFGRGFDQKSSLHIFKKGIEIASGASQAVLAPAAGKVAFAGELPNYGRVTIIDHGDHFYTLCGKLGALGRKQGENVAAGERIGETDESGTPLYFEIRSRNIPVNPLQWVSI